jgi:hypothetical protein
LRDGRIYARPGAGPRAAARGLLSIGEEPNRAGDAESAPAAQGAPVGFIGNIEARDLPPT